MSPKGTVIAPLAFLISAGTAIAADFSPIVINNTNTTTVAPPIQASAAFDWAGPYMGAYGGYMFSLPLIQAGIQAGTMFGFGPALAGFEIQGGAVYAGGFGGEANINGRLGFPLGNALVYAEGGAGILAGPLIYTWNAGGGVEFGLNDRVSVFAEGKYVREIGAAPIGISVVGGVNIRRGN